MHCNSKVKKKKYKKNCILFNRSHWWIIFKEFLFLFLFYYRCNSQSPFFLRFLYSLPQILLSFPFLQILTNQTDCKILNQICNFQFQHKPINPLLQWASSSSTASFFLFCCGFFFSHFECNVSLSSCLLGEQEELSFSFRWKRWVTEETRWWVEEKKRYLMGMGKKCEWLRKKWRKKKKKKKKLVGYMSIM